MNWHLKNASLFQVWFSNRRARLRKHAGSIAHSVASLPLTPCQYASHELAQLPQVPQIPSGIAQIPTTLHHSPTTLQQTSGGVHQVPGSNAQMSATTSAAQVPSTISSALQGHAVSISGHLSSLQGHAMQLGQVPTIQPPAAHGAPTTLSHNPGELRCYYLYRKKWVNLLLFKEEESNLIFFFYQINFPFRRYFTLLCWEIYYRFII